METIRTLKKTQKVRDMSRPNPVGFNNVTLASRGKKAVEKTILLVDFYRIRRKVALPLPLATIPELPPAVGAIEVYPWLTWISWEIENRALSLCAAARSDVSGRTAEILRRDVNAVCQWDPTVLAASHALPTSHLLRVLSNLAEQPELKGVPMQNYLDQLLGALAGALEARKAVLRDEARSGNEWPKPFYNINCILVFAMAAASARIDHPSRREIEPVAREMMVSLADARRAGWTEGWSYDAYVQDFLADWLLASPNESFSAIYPALKPSLVEPFQLTLPGAGFLPPLLGDSECPEMPFHWSAAAKWLELTGDEDLAAGLQLADAVAISSDALLWWPADSEAAILQSPHVAMHSPNAVIITSETSDFKVTAGASRCQNGHLHADRGHVCIGSCGYWIVQDPGYRQYLRTSEHTFATGPTAHNLPVVNGFGQALEGVRALPLEWSHPRLNGDVYMNLTCLYPRELALVELSRSIRVGATVEIDDLIVPASETLSLDYYWHFHPKAFLGEIDDGLLIAIGDATWRMNCSACRLSLEQVSRLRGSRGQQTLKVNLPATGPTQVRWSFGKE